MVSTMRWEVKEEKRRLTDGETGNNANNDGERDRSSRNTKGHLSHHQSCPSK